MYTQSEEYKRIEREARSRAFRRIMREELGCTCANCGSGDVEYHHIVPLSLGGTNALSNIVPLCYRCHRAAHNGRHITSFADHSHSDDGRPPKCTDEEAYKALDLLADGQIGIRKCQRMMNLVGRTVPRQTRQYKKWSDERGVKMVRNYLDASITNGWQNVVNGYKIGVITYLNGERKDIVFNDTGLNDDAEYSIRGQDMVVPWSEIKKNTSETGIGAS